ncbi:TonB-dependent receptor plug domain-containing protein [Paucibacter soli]|uniref:TonB-dependent receptor plug domain-containing protein n=1 Tax=Paucibacter soli TaxID=3133433 RepID=UPI0030AC49D8
MPNKQLLVLSLMLCGLAQAQTAPEEQDLALAYGDSALVSIATGSAQPLRRAPAVAGVITADEIRAMGATDLEDVLARVPGLHVGRTSLLYAPLLVMRGIYSQFNQQVLMLHNGQPMTVSIRGDRGTKGWRGFPVENIARIEVLRGPGSALYGPEAYAGVINIISKSARDIDGQELGLRAASFGGRDAWWQGGLQRGELELAWFLRGGRSEGFKAVVEKDAQSSNDAAFGSKASLAPGSLAVGRELLDLGLDMAWQRWRLRANYQWRDMRSGMGVAQSLDPEGLERTRRLLADLSWSETQLGPDLAAGATLSLHAYQQLIPVPFLIFPAGAKFPTGSFPTGMRGAPETWERQWRLNAFVSWSGWREHQWRVGAGLDDIDLYATGEGKNFAYAANGLPIPLPEFNDHSQSDPFIRPQRRKVRYVYLQDVWNLARDWSLTAGLRHDRYSDVGGTTNPRLALVWEAAYNWTAKLLYGRAYRAPGFAELHSITNPVARGNPAVKPETIGTAEAVLLWQPRRDLQLEASAFSYRMRDIIRTTANPTPGTGTTFNNSGSQGGHGLELDAHWEPDPALRLQASLALQRARDLGNQADPGYAPHQRVYMLADWRFAPGWQASGQFNHVAGRLRALGDARPAIADYSNLDLGLRYTPPGARWSAAAMLRNVGNSDQREPSLAPGRIAGDLPLAPRSVSLELSYRL